MNNKKSQFNKMYEPFSSSTSYLKQNKSLVWGDGTESNPFTENEAERMMNQGTFYGGIVKDAHGKISYWLPEAVVMGRAPYYNPLKTDNDSYGLLDLVGDGGTITEAIEKHSGKTRVGSNYKLYFETKSGRVFFGNQYVVTTSLEGLAKMANKVMGRAGFVALGYNVYIGHKKGGTAGAIRAAGKEAGAWGGAWGGGKLGALIGGSIGSAPGALIGGVLGAIGGSIVGGEVIEIILSKYR